MRRPAARPRPKRPSPLRATIQYSSCAGSASAVANLPELETVALGNGAINSTPDIDQVIRRVPLVVALDDELYPSLAAEALRVAQGATTNVIKSSGASGVLAFGEQTGVSAVRVGEFEIPTDSEGRLWLYASRHEPARYTPAWDVLEDDFDPSDLSGQIVFVGTSAAGLHDIRATPVEPSIPGVEIHAQAIEQILAGDFLHRPDFADGMELAYMLALGLIMIVMLRTLGAIVSLRWSGGRPRCWCSRDRGCRSMPMAGCSTRCSPRSWCCSCSPPRKGSRTCSPRRNGSRYAARSSSTSRRSWSMSWRGIPNACDSAASSAP